MEDVAIKISENGRRSVKYIIIINISIKVEKINNQIYSKTCKILPNNN